MRLDVYDAGSTQLRLTRTLNGSGAGKWANFLVESTGNLVITPYSNDGGNIQNTGIGNGTGPGATLHVLGNGTSTGNLMLDYVPTTSTQTNLMVYNTSTKEVQRNTSTFITAGSSCSAPTANYVPIFASSSTLGSSQIYDNCSNVGIGTTSFTGTLLEVVDNGSNATPIIASSTGNGSNAITASVSGTNSTGVSSTAYTYGIYGTANGAHWSGASSPMVGVVGSADGTNNTGGTGSTGNAGVYGFVLLSQTTADNYGVWGLANASGTGAGTVTNFGVRGTASNGDVNWAGYFNGDVNIAGAAYCTSGAWTGSDEVLKTDIEQLNGTEALEIIGQLNPSTYLFATDLFPTMNLAPEKQYGFIAQELEPILPDFVRDVSLSDSMMNAGGYQTIKMINYEAMIPILTAAIKSLSADVASLQSQLDACCGGFGMRNSDNDQPDILNQQIVELKSLHQNYLGQSVPNPHKDQCTIPYYVEETISNAEIIFFDELGREVSRIEIVGRGAGQVTVLSSQLHDGVYSYSLIADGKVIDTKQLVRQH